MRENPPARSIIGLNSEEMDQHIYRIMPEEYVIGIFNKNENVMSQVHNWKDKFENFQLRLGGILNGETFEYSFKSDFVGQCWTREYLSEAMWGIYANDKEKRFLRIRSTPRKLLSGLIQAHPEMPQDTCFIGKVLYKTESELEEYLRNDGILQIDAARFAESLLLKRKAFSHESEIRLIYFGNNNSYNKNGLYSYSVDPHSMITQIMADPNRNPQTWETDKQRLFEATGFNGKIKRSQIYDPPRWKLPNYRTK